MSSRWACTCPDRRRSRWLDVRQIVRMEAPRSPTTVKPAVLCLTSIPTIRSAQWRGKHERPSFIGKQHLVERDIADVAIKLAALVATNVIVRLAIGAMGQHVAFLADSRVIYRGPHIKLSHFADHHGGKLIVLASGLLDVMHHD